MKQSNWLRLDQVELMINDVPESLINLEDADYDAIRLIYWIKADSPTATLLALKGCRFNQPDAHKFGKITG